jgi:hypothetical protein
VVTVAKCEATANNKHQTSNKKKCLLFIAVPVSTDKKTGIVILPHSSNQQQVKLSKDCKGHG